MKFKIIDFVDSPCMIICSPLINYANWKGKRITSKWFVAFEVSAIFDFVKPIKSFETLENLWFSVVLRTIQNFGCTEREMVRSPSLNTHLRTPQSLALTTEFCCNALSRSCSFRMKLVIAKLSQRMIYRKT